MLEIIEFLDYDTFLKLTKLGFAARELELKDIAQIVRREVPANFSKPRTAPPFCISGPYRIYPLLRRMFAARRTITVVAELLLEIFALNQTI